MSTNLARNVIAAFSEIDLSRRLQALGVENARLKAMEREFEEVERAIPLWDRVIFFSDSEGERRAKALRAEIAAGRAAFDKDHGLVDADLDGVAARYPPVELWRRIDRCVKLAHRELEITGILSRKPRKPKALIDALEGLAARILDIYVPGFDPQRLVESLRDEDTCRQISRPAAEITRQDPDQGYASIDPDGLMALIAGEMLEAGYFRAEARLERLAEREQEHRRHWEAAKAEVGLLSDLNVLSDSPEEQRRNAAAEAARQARQQWIAADEENRLALVSFLEAYPPLTLHLQVGAVLGALSALAPAREHQLNLKTGEVFEAVVVEPRALVLDALQGLKRAFLKVFPGIPMPSTVEQKAEAGAAQHATLEHSPRNQILRDFTQSMDRREGQALMAQCHVHASMQHSWHQTRLKGGDRVAWADKLAMWSKSEAQSAVDYAKARERWHMGALAERWQALLALAREAAHEQPPLLIRDFTISANLHMHAITTASPCRASHHREDTLKILADLRTVIARAYGLQGSRGQFMADVANRLTNYQPRPIETEAFRRRSYDEVLELMAFALHQTPYRALFMALSDETRAYNEAARQQQDVSAQISFWDRINFLSDTAEEQTRDALGQQMKSLNATVQQRSAAVDELLEGAMVRYPPALLYYRIGRVEAAVGAIYARLVTRTYTDSKGRSRTTTSCELYGKKAATEAMRYWNFALTQTFGPLPGYHECLERWISF